MNNVDFQDMTSIINFGLGLQNRLADLNAVAAGLIKVEEYDDLLKLLDKLFSMSSETEDFSLPEKEQYLDKIEADLEALRMVLLKEEKLLEALRYTNDAYLQELDENIQAAREFLKTSGKGKGADARTKADTLSKRVEELVLTRSVGESFSAQLKLGEDNDASMANRIWEVRMQLVPLLRGRINMEVGQKTVAQARKILLENCKEVEASRENKKKWRLGLRFQKS